jgi:hypothetical protein
MANAYNATPVFAALTEVGPNSVTSSFNLANTVSAAGLALNDTISFVKIPVGALLTRLLFDLCQVDSSGSPALLFDVGTDLTTGQGGVGAAGFFSQSTAGRSATYNVISEEGDSTYVHGSLPFNYTLFGVNSPQFSGILVKDASIVLKVHTAPATATTSGIIYCTAEYTMVNVSNLE